MALTLDIYLDRSSDQELVDLYAAHAPGVSGTVTDNQIHHASTAAYALERRGYVEQAGAWKHNSLPALQATA
jgi:hypothetical protein